MDNLPINDIPMLLSVVNTLLRDNEFDTIEELCEHYGITREELDSRMKSQGFEYSEQQKKYW